MSNDFKEMTNCPFRKNTADITDGFSSKLLVKSRITKLGVCLSRNTKIFNNFFDNIFSSVKEFLL